VIRSPGTRGGSGGAGAGDLLRFEKLSASSPLARDLRLLGRDAAERRSRSIYLAEGIHLLQEAMKEPSRIDLVVFSPRVLRSEEGRALVEAASAGGLRVLRSDDLLLGALSHVESHQGVLLTGRRPRRAAADLMGGPAPARVLVAVGVQDPGNVGALARVAEAASCSGFVCAGPCADPFSPRSMRAGAGSMLRLPVVEFTAAGEAAAVLRSLGLRLLGAAPRSGTEYRRADLGGAFALFVGAEGPGLSAEERSSLDGEVRIPIRDGVESLNVAVAAAVILFEAAGRNPV